MQIKYHGHTCFEIQENGNTLLFDPYNNSIGLTPPKANANILSVSWKEAPYNNATQGPDGKPALLDWPGEYEINGIHFKRIASIIPVEEGEDAVENTITIVHWGKIRLGHLGMQGAKLNEEQLEQIGEVDILFVPVGGTPLLDAKKAKEVVDQIEPRIVIPMAYHTEGSSLGLQSADAFLSSMGAGVLEPVSSFVAKRSELPEETTKVVLLSVVG